jgi:enoyl-CoA hydratase/carnithine racemase
VRLSSPSLRRVDVERTLALGTVNAVVPNGAELEKMVEIAQDFARRQHARRS